MYRRSLNAALVAALLMGSLAAFSGTASSAPGDRVVGRYIVVLRDSVADPGAVAAEQSRAEGANVDHVYRYALKGYAGTMSAAAADHISRDPRVDHVEADQVASVAAQTMPTGVDRIDVPATTNTTLTNLGIDGVDDKRVDADVAVIDTGVDSAHPDLNVVRGTDCTGSPFNDVCTDGTATDGNGHATHVAGTIGALDNGIGVVGVAPGARIWSVRVLNNSGSGYMSWIVAGIDWVDSHHSEIEVANMSLGCECSSSAMDSAINATVADGVTFAVAAGNSDKDVSTFSPANNPNVIAVSALADFNGRSGGGGASTCRTDQDDTLADFSNWGSTVDIAAPGVCILSTWPNGGYNTISGTSMASPHVAGAAALLKSLNPSMLPSNVRSSLQSSGNLDWTDDSGDGVKEKLLDVSGITPVFVGSGTGGGTTNANPTASFTSSCTGLTCGFTDTSTDSDGTIASRSWTFGDGGTSTATNPAHTYAGGGNYTVTLTVTDDAGGTATVSHSVSVSSSGIVLSATGRKVKGLQKADLAWSPPGTGNVDVFRNGAIVQTTPNDGSYTDNINLKGAGSYTYRVCLAGTATCSNDATVTF